MLLVASSLTAAQTDQAAAKLNSPSLASTSAAAASHASLTYRLRNNFGRPLTGISVEVRNPQTHAVINSAFTGPNGEVKFNGLSPGRYEITVAGGILPPRREVQVEGGDIQGVLELPLSQSKVHETISVGELTVPRQAKDALNAAAEAWQKQDWKKARAQAMRALALHPKYAAALSMLGFLDLREGNWEQACTNVKGALESDPNSALAYLTLGAAYNSMKRFEAALEALSVFPSVSADTWQVHYELARSYIGLRKYELGLLEINSSQKLTKQDPAVLHLGKAHALAGLHRDSEAMEELEALLRKQPNGPFAPDAQNFLAVLRSQKNH